MKFSTRFINYAVALLCLLCADDLMANDNHQAAHQHETSEGLILTAKQRQLAGIRIAPATTGFHPQIRANAVLMVDRDRSFAIVPQLDVQVLKRHVQPGQWVKAQQALLTLGGVDVAQAQARFINAASDWQRISQMDESAISDSARQQAQVALAQARAVLQALQMTDEQLNTLKSRPELIGRYQLLAPISGRVQQDNSHLGQLQGAGELLLQLTDESSLWVAAELSPSQAQHLEQSDTLLVRIDDALQPANIIGRSHELSQNTRTERVLARIDNRTTRWHAGQFAEVLLPQAEQQGVLLPDSALSRSADGDWQVFIAMDEGFQPQEVNVRQRRDGLNLVTGLAVGTPVAMSGAFFLASELAKSGFSVHNH